MIMNRGRMTLADNAAFTRATASGKSDSIQTFLTQKSLRRKEMAPDRAASAAEILTHHTRVLVFQDVAVEHEGMGARRGLGEVDQDFGEP